MLKRIMAVALMASTMSGNHVLAEENGREPAVILVQRPQVQTTYLVWYKGSRMNHWAVYVETPNRRWADNVASMLLQIGYAAYVETVYN
jgi:hypothetical protein